MAVRRRAAVTATVPMRAEPPAHAQQARTEVAGETVELIREVLPSARRFAVLANETDPFTKPFLAAIGLGAGSGGAVSIPGFRG